MPTLTTHTLAVASFLQDAETFAGREDQNSPYAGLREKAKEAFSVMGIPGRKQEEWKYLDLSPIANTEFRNAGAAFDFVLGPSDAESYRLAGKEALLLVLENGKLNTHASPMERIPAGIRIGTLSTLGHEALVTEHLFRHAAVEGEPFVAMNTMLSHDPLILLVEPKAEIKTPIQLAFVAVAGADPLAVTARVLVVAGEGSECTVMESYHTYGEGAPSFTNAVTEVVISASARLHYTKVQVESGQAQHISYHKVNMARDSYQHLTTLTLGGALVRNNLHIRLDDQHINAYLNGLYVMNGSQVVDNHTLVDHAMPNCHSNELYKGIINDRAQGVFNGKIWVRQDAQKTNAYQSNKNLLLSNEASMNTKPQLEIFADDVKCSHGATTGQLDDEALFYLRARGIGEANARTLLNHAFAADVIEQVENDDIQQSLMHLLDTKLN
ncbi:MAG: Fe-S cluster assembly protein SufD [Bacteroidia bacterium]|nr:Fe-S cluster assembly protein SufD [Bacteroidia bacterium]